MRQRTFALALAVSAVMATGAWGPLPIAPAPIAPTKPTVIGVETLDVTIPASLHAQGLAVPAKLVRPKWDRQVGRQPAMMVLHGSGGLLKTPQGASATVCSPAMEAQYVEWADRLATLGYTVLLPSSYSARGFCDKHDDAGRIPQNFNTDLKQVVARIYDTDAASRYLCARSDVDCSRMGVLGFSQGGTMAMLALHRDLDQALAQLRQTKATEVGIPIPALKAGRPSFKSGVAYYPGCGFDSVIPLSTGDPAVVTDKYSPTAPLTIHHGSKDPLVVHCSTLYGPGTREIQAAQVAAKLKVPNQYQVTVYADANHSFDNPNTVGADKVARDAALKVTLTKLAAQM